MDGDLETLRLRAQGYNFRVEAFERNLRDYADKLESPDLRTLYASALPEMKENLLESVADLRELHRVGEQRLTPEERETILDRLEAALKNGDHKGIRDIESRLTCGLKPSFRSMGHAIPGPHGQEPPGAHRAAQRPVLRHR